MNLLLSLTKQKYNHLTYQGTFELDFINKYYNKINIQNGMTIKYDENKVYYPDFFIPELNLIVEIKSDYFYKKYLLKNLKKIQ